MGVERSRHDLATEEEGPPVIFWALCVARNLLIAVTGLLIRASSAANHGAARLEIRLMVRRGQRAAATLGPTCEHMAARGALGPCFPCWRAQKSDPGRSRPGPEDPTPTDGKPFDPPKAA